MWRPQRQPRPLPVVERGGAIERVWTYRFTDLEGKPQRMEFAKIGGYRT
jgi:hypothetical protein